MKTRGDFAKHNTEPSEFRWHGLFQYAKQINHWQMKWITTHFPAFCFQCVWFFVLVCCRCYFQLCWCLKLKFCSVQSNVSCMAAMWLQIALSNINTSWYGSFEVDEVKSNQLIKLKQTRKKRISTYMMLIYALLQYILRPLSESYSDGIARAWRGLKLELMTVDCY